MKKLVSISGGGFECAHKIGVFEIRFNWDMQSLHFRTLKEAKDFFETHRADGEFLPPQKIEKNRYIVTKHTSKTRKFTLLREAKGFYQHLQEPAAFWDMTKIPELIDCKDWA